MNIQNNDGSVSDVDIDPRAETIKILEDMLADIKASPDIPTHVIIRKSADGGLEQHICGMLPDLVHILHSSMCGSEQFETMIELATEEHLLCQAVRSGQLPLPPWMRDTADDENADVPASDEDKTLTKEERNKLSGKYADALFDAFVDTNSDASEADEDEKFSGGTTGIGDDAPF